MQKAVIALLALSFAALVGGAHAADKTSGKAATPDTKQEKKEVVKKKINKSSEDKKAVKKPEEKK